MTLIEVVVSLVIVVMLVGLAIPTLSNITRVELRTSASKTSGMIKSTYDTAVLTGHTHRLLFDLDKKTITAEVATGYVALTRGGDAEAKRDKDKKDKDKKHESDDDGSAALLAIAKRVTDVGDTGPVQKASFTALGKPYDLPDGIRIADIQSEHLREPVKQGREAIYFFPTGYSEHAMIHFEDNGGHVYAVEVEPLSGRTKISDHRAEYKDEQ
jgi:general secretion pathway protein H